MFFISVIYFIGLIITSAATGYLTDTPKGFLMLGLGAVLYAVAGSLFMTLSQKS